MKEFYVIQEAFLGNDGSLITTNSALVESIKSAKAYIKFHSEREPNKPTLWTYHSIYLYEDAIINIFKGSKL